MDKEFLPQQILKLLRDKNYYPSDIGGIAKMMNLQRRDFPVFRDTLERMVKEGSVAHVKGGRYAAVTDLDLVAGEIELRPSGKAQIRVSDKEIISVRREDTGTAFNGDRVLARKHKERNDFRRGRREKTPQAPVLYARVIRVLERKQATVVGTLQRNYNFWHVVPDDPKFYYHIIVADPARSNLPEIPQDGDKVVVKLNDWTQKHINPSGEIVENLGHSHTPMAEYRAILKKFDLVTEFPEDVLAEVKSIPTEVTEDDIKGRLDLRENFTITIDPSDAKDFDDAISIRRIQDRKLIEIGVHIADVSYYVKGGSALDKEAQRRGNSTYLVGTVIPMLPFELSNGICSLVEDKDRLVKSVFLEFDTTGDCKGVRFANSVIRSNKRLSYRQAYALLKENNLDKIKAVKHPEEYQTGFAGKNLEEFDDKFIVRLRSAVRLMWSLASALRKKRMNKGSLDLDMPETRIYVDKDGYADRIEKVPYDESHQLIEEFMLSANEAVARELFQAHIPFISRVHADPDEDKLMDFRDYAEPFGIFTGDLTRRREVMKVLAMINKHPQGYVLKTQFLRSLKRAIYRASPDGHYGLMKDYYAHFTSPIRRYADFTVHRALNFYMKATKSDTAPKGKVPMLSQSYLEGVADHISKTEAKSTDAERESRKVKLLEFFERKIGIRENFEAVVTSMTGHGFFVELTESMAYGFVHMHSLHDDIYKLNVEGNVFRGRRSGKTIKIGDKIRVAVESVDMYKRQIDFMKVADEKNIKKT